MYHCAGFLSYASLLFPSILRRMLERDVKEKPKEVNAVEDRKGCPLCEYNDPELELDLRLWAQWLLDVYLWRLEQERKEGCIPPG